jgi:hypothetical protein
MLDGSRVIRCVARWRAGTLPRCLNRVRALLPFPGRPGASLSDRQVLAGPAARGWVPCGAGDRAVARRSPRGTLVARVCPVDPAYRPWRSWAASAPATGRCRPVPTITCGGIGKSPAITWAFSQISNAAATLSASSFGSSRRNRGAGACSNLVSSSAVSVHPWSGPVSSGVSAGPVSQASPAWTVDHQANALGHARHQRPAGTTISPIFSVRARVC